MFAINLVNLFRFAFWVRLTWWVGYEFEWLLYEFAEAVGERVVGFRILSRLVKLGFSVLPWVVLINLIPCILMN